MLTLLDVRHCGERWFAGGLALPCTCTCTAAVLSLSVLPVLESQMRTTNRTADHCVVLDLSLPRVQETPWVVTCAVRAPLAFVVSLDISRCFSLERLALESRLFPVTFRSTGLILALAIQPGASLDRLLYFWRTLLQSPMTKFPDRSNCSRLIGAVPPIDI
jgi:hypothetical protein